MDGRFTLIHTHHHHYNLKLTAGDFLKISWTNAYAATVLAWGFLEWSDAYEKAGETQNLLNCIRWPLDFLLKAHTGPNEFVVQVRRWLGIRIYMCLSQ